MGRPEAHKCAVFGRIRAATQPVHRPSATKPVLANAKRHSDANASTAAQMPLQFALQTVASTLISALVLDRIFQILFTPRHAALPMPTRWPERLFFVLFVFCQSRKSKAPFDVNENGPDTLRALMHVKVIQRKNQGANALLSSVNPRKSGQFLLRGCLKFKAHSHCASASV